MVSTLNPYKIKLRYARIPRDNRSIKYKYSLVPTPNTTYRLKISLIFIDY